MTCIHGVTMSRIRCLTCVSLAIVEMRERSIANYVRAAVPDEGTLSELLRAVCERLARLVTPDGAVGI
jgi:hypothetical protein